MKKIRSIFLLLTLLCLMVVGVSAATPGSEKFIYDDAQLLSKNEYAALQEQLKELSNTYDTQIVVATLRSVNGGDADILAEAFYDGKDLGYGDRRDGIMLIIMMDIREFRILSNGEAAEAKSRSIAASNTCTDSSATENTSIPRSPLHFSVITWRSLSHSASVCCSSSPGRMPSRVS